MLSIGRYQVQSIVTGTFRLDGGAMFGVVPRVLWSKATTPDEENRIALATRSLLMVDQTAGRIIIADTGCGTKWRPEDAKRFAIEHDGAAVTRALHSLGACEGDVTDVIVTHLHFDHNGGITDWADESRKHAVPRYPKARHWIHRRQWDHTNNPTPKDRASYFVEDFKAIEEAGLFHFVEGEEPPSPFEDLDWFLSKGHTPYQILPKVGRGGKIILFTGDAIPTSAHLRVPWVMAYDLYPLTTIAEKELMLTMAIEQGVLLAFPHDPQIGIASVGGSVDRPVIKEIIEH
jgi:glyoxylase-like metal-dependent hydrolase (beta-lactamase superfamily II)